MGHQVQTWFPLKVCNTFYKQQFFKQHQSDIDTNLS